jgi:hypothetical protein
MIFVQSLHKLKYFLCAYFCIAFTSFASACTLFELQKTNITSEASGQLVTLHWAGNDSDIYRLQIVANIPEGGIFWNLDTQLKGRVFSFKLLGNLAVIKVQISSDCNDAELNNVQTVKPTLFINEKKSCSISTEDWWQEGSFIKFKPKNTILSYSLSLYEVISASTGGFKSNLIKKIDIKPPYISMQDEKVLIDIKEKLNLKTLDSKSKLLVSVLPICTAGSGLSLAFLLNQ